MSTALVTVFAITTEATREAARKLLDRMKGILVSDRATIYLFWAMDRRQICWAHLLRRFVALAERGGQGSQIARELREVTELMFHHWHRVRDGTMTRRAFGDWMVNVRERIEWLLERGALLGVRGFSGVCKDILKHREALFVFVDHRGVEPTNNRAEQDLRPFVQWRKTSYGSQSDRGERYAERIMTVTSTLRKQQRPVFDYLHQACLASLTQRPAPSLIPTL
jgi:transposase